MYYKQSNFIPTVNLVPLLEYCCPWSEVDKNLGDKDARLCLFKALGWPEELEKESQILVGKLQPGQEMLIHKDTIQETHNLYSALNIPLTDNVRFEWYKGTTIQSDSRMPTKKLLPILENNEAQLVESYQQKNAVWVSVKDWHRIVNTGNTTAWMLSFRWPHLAGLEVKDIDPTTHYPWI